MINFPEELRVGETRLASAEDLDSLQSEVEVKRGRENTKQLPVISCQQYRPVSMLPTRGEGEDLSCTEFGSFYK